MIDPLADKPHAKTSQEAEGCPEANDGIPEEMGFMPVGQKIKDNGAHQPEKKKPLQKAGVIPEEPNELNHLQPRCDVDDPGKKTCVQRRDDFKEKIRIKPEKGGTDGRNG